jgi:hypothetical protein
MTDAELWGVVVDAFDPAEGLRTVVDLFGPYDEAQVVDEVERILDWVRSKRFRRDHPGMNDPGAVPYRLRRGLGLRVARGRHLAAVVQVVDPPVTELWLAQNDRGANS